MDIRNLSQATAFITKDGSEIRELLAHRNSCIRNQSLAEARGRSRGQNGGALSSADGGDLLHRRRHGLMTIDHEQHPVGPGDAVAIPPGTVHQIFNSGIKPLVFLCCCTGL